MFATRTDACPHEEGAQSLKDGRVRQASGAAAVLLRVQCELAELILRLLAQWAVHHRDEYARHLAAGIRTCQPVIRPGNHLRLCLLHPGYRHVRIDLRHLGLHEHKHFRDRRLGGIV